MNTGKAAWIRFRNKSARLYRSFAPATKRKHFAAKHKKNGIGDVLDCIITFNEYGVYCVPRSSSHRPAAYKLLSGRVYEPQTIAFMLENCASGDIIHAGAYFGDFLPALARQIGFNSKIWAFEPNTENYRCAQITLIMNGISNVVLSNSAVGASRAESNLTVKDSSGKDLGGASTLITGKPGGSGREQQVTVVPIDETIPNDRHVSIIQLDVEGYEKEALVGGMLTIRRCRPILILETLPGVKPIFEDEWFIHNFMDEGYQVSGYLHGNVILKHVIPRKKHA